MTMPASQRCCSWALAGTTIESELDHDERRRITRRKYPKKRGTSRLPDPPPKTGEAEPSRRPREQPSDYRGIEVRASNGQRVPVGVTTSAHAMTTPRAVPQQRGSAGG